jgi:hypothetical protein
MIFIMSLKAQKGLLSLDGNVQQTPTDIVRIREVSNSNDYNIVDSVTKNKNSS